MELWTSLVCLVADPACQNFKRFGGGKGAYVNVVAWAESASFPGSISPVRSRSPVPSYCLSLAHSQTIFRERGTSVVTIPEKLTTTSDVRKQRLLYGAMLN